MQKCATALWEMQQPLMKPLKDNAGQEEHLKLLEELQKLLPLTSMGTETGHSVGIPEYMTTVRVLLPKVSPGQEVLGRWSHDGWYHRGLVLHVCDDQSFILQNGAGMLERVWREDIITKGDDTSHEIKVEHPVISAHPLYPGHYCPATILSIPGDLQIKVRYYDGSEATVPRDQVYLVPAEKFEQDVAYALECEQRWVGEPVVARCDNTGTYHPAAEVEQQVGIGRQYLIRWADGTSTVQDRDRIFGKWSPWRILVLSPCRSTPLLLDLRGAVCQRTRAGRQRRWKRRTVRRVKSTQNTQLTPLSRMHPLTDPMLSSALSRNL
ncbi:uncharacterized protein LOC108933051 isoform X3 [Scleropages formosus]|uniref:uncharacterized protein LOC108933051 isoform X3 n=1 Tax=Scleropages formosus TaxID=113540 RepID=UPI0010FA8472|nr:uncharacterized protein LOC108933051 isoform X3 [Scleropages formosus]